MNNDLNCIICGKEIDGKAYYGNLKSMDIVFCEDHREYCNKCEIKHCKGKDCKVLN